MLSSKDEIRKFLDSKVGTIVVNKPDASYNGHCVTLIKTLLEFLGIPDPYIPRGNAKDVGNTLINQGIATPGKGWLTIAINKDMGVSNGVKYGHIWIDLADEANYESNGAKTLTTTKNTRSLSQGQQFINLDKYVGENDMKVTLEMVQRMAQTVGGRLGYGGRDNNKGADLPAHVGVDAGKEFENWYWSDEGRAYRDGWLPSVVNFWVTYKDAIANLQARPTPEQLQALGRELATKSTEVEKANKLLIEAQEKTRALEIKEEAATKTGNAFMQWLGGQLNKILGGK